MPVTKYLYFGDQLLGETDETGTVTRRYINEPDEYTHPIGHVDVDTGESFYYHYDGQGNTREVTDENENVTDTFTYDSWGNLLSRTGMTNVPFQFGGEHGYYKDEELDTYYVMARVYDPGIIRWLSVDPIAGQYIYDRNNPTASPLMFLLFNSALFQEQPGRAKVTTPGQTPGVAYTGCKFKLCSTPVDRRATSGANAPRSDDSPGGHLVIICDNRGYRGGPGGFCGKGPKDCDARYDWPFGQLVTTEGPYDPDNPEEPKFIDYLPPAKEQCITIQVRGMECKDLCGCFSKTLKAIDECCITYNFYPPPLLPMVFGANSNSTIRWLLEECVRFTPPLPPFNVDDIDLPGEGRIHPGFKSPMPDCVKTGRATYNP